MESRCPHCKELYWKIFVKRPFIVDLEDGSSETIYFNNTPYCRFCNRDIMSNVHVEMIESTIKEKFNGKARWRKNV